MSHADLERMILERLVPFVLQVEGAIPDTQFGFMRDRSTVDAIFVSRCLSAHVLKLDGGQLFKCFVDLKKAYDNVDRDLMWKILLFYGIPENLIQVIKGKPTQRR